MWRARYDIRLLKQTVAAWRMGGCVVHAGTREKKKERRQQATKESTGSRILRAEVRDVGDAHLPPPLSQAASDGCAVGFSFRVFSF